MSWHDLLPLAVFLVTLHASFLSGIAGGGGGFIVTPFFILIGLTPQETVATMKFGSFGLTSGAFAAFRKKALEHKNLSIFIVALAAIIGLVSSFFLQKVDNKSLQLLMGIFMLLMVPITLIKTRKSQQSRATKLSIVIGSLFLAVALLLQGILSGGIGSLVGAIFMTFFGVSAIEANALKRKASLILNLVIVATLLRSGLINYVYGLSGMAGGLVGGYLGTHYAIKKGDELAKYALLVFMIVSGIWLIASA
jgi:uncharacterized membrane protein YfcA